MNAICRPLAGLLLAAFASGPALAGPRAVVELFTSQGCASCPPADRLLSEYAGRDDVLALSFSVDYWDYLGWKDTLASPDNTERQRAYAEGRGDSQVYTPQIVINGREHVVGSDRSAIDAAIARIPPLAVDIGLSETEDAITVSLAGHPDGAPDGATLWLVLFQSDVDVLIERGENAGRTVRYSNVVRKLRPIAMWKGEAMSVDLPKSEMAKARMKRCAVLLQTEDGAGQPGIVLGAAVLDNDAALPPAGAH